MSSNPIFGARIPVELRERLEARMHESGQSKSDLLIDALGRYLDLLDGKLVPAGEQVTPSDLGERLAAVEERMLILEEMLLEESMSFPPQPQYEQRLRPVPIGIVGNDRRY